MTARRSAVSGELRERRPSSWFLLVFAVTTSAMVLLAGSLLMLALFSPEDAAMPAGSIDWAGQNAPFVVAVARTPGGPSEWKAYMRALSNAQENLGRTISVRYVSNGDEAPTLLRSGSADAAFLSTSRYLALERSADVTLVAAPIVDGRLKDAAVLVVDSRQPYRTIEDMRGTRALVSSASSLAGNTYFYWYLNSRDISAATFFSNVATSTSQNTNLRDVLAGKAEVTSVNRSALASWPKSAFRVVAQSPEFGMPPLVALSSSDATTVERLRNSLVEFGRHSGIPEGSVLGGFSAPSPRDYAFSRVLARYAASLDPSLTAGGEER